MRLRRTVQRVRWWAVRLGVACTAGLITLILLGLIAEAYLYLRNPTAYSDARTARSEVENSVFDRRVGVCFTEADTLPFAMIPGRYAIDDGATITINRLGYRGREFSKIKARNTLRVLFLGDSFTYGFGVDDDETIPSLVEAMLNKRLFGGEDSDGSTLVARPRERERGTRAHGEMDRVEVINAGFHGSSPMQYDLYLRTEGYALEPDLIVLVIYSGNDIADLSYNVVEEAGDDGRPTRISDGLTCYEGRRFRTVLPGSIYMLPGLDRMAVWHAFNKRLYAAFEGPRHAAITHEAELAFFLRPLAAIALDAQERSIALQAWIVVGREMLDLRWAGRGTQDYQDVWQTLDRLGIETVDFAPVLMTHDVAEICFPNDLHINAQGNRLVAEAGIGRLTDRVVAVMEQSQTPALAAGEDSQD